ncbi:prepilin-type N-terminal cleavage/methylation domain-containing protein [Caloramator sp. E03]|uniref:PilW family protein n=1 Tax=Caloramator sp. E03 TaxID=2576307 RepID=UPI0011107A2A|nr:prepilin-type N-terminal cleavage/methylation domain-containing protein [Caloramator sp. E03]QCX32669.1 prepilin-type N-terminal cleavage/methylation domain-containing protein [Caloramator sp. E03]
MNKKGFTLIEILITSAVLFILLGALYSFFNSNYKILFEEKRKAYIESQVKSFMDFTMQSLQMSYQEKIEVTDGGKKLILYLPPNDDSKVEFDAEKSVNIEINYEDDSIVITKNGVDKTILKGFVKYFEIKKILYDNGDLESIEIKFKVNYDFKFRNIDKDYLIKYNIRK